MHKELCLRQLKVLGRGKSVSWSSMTFLEDNNTVSRGACHRFWDLLYIAMRVLRDGTFF